MQLRQSTRIGKPPQTSIELVPPCNASSAVGPSTSCARCRYCAVKSWQLARGQPRFPGMAPGNGLEHHVLCGMAVGHWTSAEPNETALEVFVSLRVGNWCMTVQHKKPFHGCNSPLEESCLYKLPTTAGAAEKSTKESTRFCTVQLDPSCAHHGGMICFWNVCPVPNAQVPHEQIWQASALDL